MLHPWKMLRSLDGSAVEAHLRAAAGSCAPFMWPGTHLGRQCCRPIPIHPVGLYNKPELDLARWIHSNSQASKCRLVGCPSIWISCDAETPAPPQGGECGVFCFWFVMFVLREMWDLSDAYCTDAHTSWSSHVKHHSEGEQTDFVFTSGVENTSSKLIDEFFLRKSETCRGWSVQPTLSTQRFYARPSWHRRDCTGK